MTKHVKSLLGTHSRRIALLIIVITLGVLGVIVANSTPKSSVAGYYSIVKVPSDLTLTSSRRVSNPSTAGHSEAWDYEYSSQSDSQAIIQEYAQALRQAGFNIGYAIPAKATAITASNGRITVRASVTNDKQLSVLVQGMN